MAKKFKHLKSHKAAINQAMAQGQRGVSAGPTIAPTASTTPAHTPAPQMDKAELKLHLGDTYRSLIFIVLIIALFVALSLYDRNNHVLLPLADQLFDRFVR